MNKWNNQNKSGLGVATSEQECDGLRASMRLSEPLVEYSRGRRKVPSLRITTLRILSLTRCTHSFFRTNTKMPWTWSRRIHLKRAACVLCFLSESFASVNFRYASRSNKIPNLQDDKQHTSSFFPESTLKTPSDHLRWMVCYLPVFPVWLKDLLSNMINIFYRPTLISLEF